jgi:hypothetical protein
LRSASLQASLRPALPDSFATMLGDLGISTLRFDQYHDLVFFSFLSIKTAMLPASLLEDYSMSASSTPCCFPRRTDLSGNLFPITSSLDLLSLFLLFWIIIPAILPTTMLGYYSMSASLMPSEIFHRHFDLLENCFL